MATQQSLVQTGDSGQLTCRQLGAKLFGEYDKNYKGMVPLGLQGVIVPDHEKDLIMKEVQKIINAIDEKFRSHNQPTLGNLQALLPDDSDTEMDRTRKHRLLGFVFIRAAVRMYVKSFAKDVMRHLERDGNLRVDDLEEYLRRLGMCPEDLASTLDTINMVVRGSGPYVDEPMSFIHPHTHCLYNSMKQLFARRGDLHMTSNYLPLGPTCSDGVPEVDMDDDADDDESDLLRDPSTYEGDPDDDVPLQYIGLVVSGTKEVVRFMDELSTDPRALHGQPVGISADQVVNAVRTAVISGGDIRQSIVNLHPYSMQEEDPWWLKPIADHISNFVTSKACFNNTAIVHRVLVSDEIDWT